MHRVGLNPYGLVYTLGLLGRGTPRANPEPLSVEGYVGLASHLGAGGVELDGSMLLALDQGALERLSDQLRAAKMWVVVASGLHRPAHLDVLALAPRLGARVMRLALTTVLAGDRAALGARWPELVGETRMRLRAAATRARELGVELALENHQDFTSGELLELCEETGPGVGICMDTGNVLAVGESCEAFARAVLPHLRHVHLKDYRVQPTSEGFRLVRCALGDGAVPVASLLRWFGEQDVSAALECGAHEARHVRLLAPGFWDLYPPGSAARADTCLASLLPARLAPEADWRTPWERGAASAEILDFERAELERSVAYLCALGVWPKRLGS